MLAILRKPVVGFLFFVICAVAEVEIAELWQRIKDGKTLGVQASQLPETPIQPVVEYEPPEKPEIAQPVEVPRDFPWEFKPGKEFDIFALSQEYRWGLGTNAVIDPDGQSADMGNNLEELLEQYGRNYQDLIAVGTASCEGEEGPESVRAGSRGQQMIIWLRRALQRIGDTKERPLYYLNLGRFKSCDGSQTGQTGDQRRVIVVAVKQKPQDMDRERLEQALKQELDDPVRRPLGFRMDDYMRFALNEAR